MKQLLSPRQAAQAIGVSESSIKRWCDNGLIKSVRTAGGHRRLRISSVFQFMREGDHQVRKPSVLGLRAQIGGGGMSVVEGRRRFLDALMAGDEHMARDVVLDLYLAGQRVSVIADDVIAATLHEIGELWDCGNIEVYEERRSCEICLSTLRDLRMCLPPCPESARTALGATLPGDPYAVAVGLGELVLRENGWDAVLLGSRVPIDALCHAILEHQPRLFWVSVSSVPDEQQLVDDLNRLFEIGAEHATALAVGGRALHDKLRKRLRYSTFCDTLQHMEQFLATC